MEAVGLMNDFPCLVIRGISDYSDSHKHKRWQRYAAATAVAYAKELLQIVPASEVVEAPAVSEFMDVVNAKLKRTELRLVRFDERLENISREQRFRLNHDVSEWLAQTDYAAQQQELSLIRLEGTCAWILRNKGFRVWQQGDIKALMCSGPPGAGRTIMASTIIDHLKASLNTTTSMAYTFFSYALAQRQRSVDHMICVLIKQLCQNLPSLPDSVEKMYLKHLRTRSRPSLPELANTLEDFVSRTAVVYIILDALDEMTSATTVYCNFFSALQDIAFSSGSDVRILATSRYASAKSKEFVSTHGFWMFSGYKSPQEKEFIRSKTDNLAVSTQPNIPLRSKIIEGVMSTTDGVFLLAKLQMDSLKDKMTEAEIDTALENLPKGPEALQEAYRDVVHRINAQPRDLAKLAWNILTYVFLSHFALKPNDLGLALCLCSENLIPSEVEIPDARTIAQLCQGLVVVESDGTVTLAHATAQAYLQRFLQNMISNPTIQLANFVQQLVLSGS